MLSKPNTCKWDFKILSSSLLEHDLEQLRTKIIRIKGDPCELVPVEHNPIELLFQDFDDFEVTMILNRLLSDNNITIEIARLNNLGKPIIKHSYLGCIAISSHSYNSKLNCINENREYGKILIKFNWKVRNIVKI